MYQFPVRGLEKIRRTRRKVKNILGEIGLEECLSLGQVCLLWKSACNETGQIRTEMMCAEYFLLYYIIY